MRFPVDQPYHITNYFSTAHLGIDIAPTPTGTPGRHVISPEPSVVHQLGNNPELEGKYIILRGDSGVYYYFGHFATQLVPRGQRLVEGQPIGVMGMTGMATGIHTHHEVRPGQPGPGTQIDPVAYYKSKGGNVYTQQDYRTGAEAASFTFGDNFDYPANKSNTDFVNLLLDQTPKVTKEMESHVADTLSGVTNYIGWDGYSSPYVGKPVGTVYPQMFDDWAARVKAAGITPQPGQPAPEPIPDPDGEKWRSYSKLSKELLA